MNRKFSLTFVIAMITFMVALFATSTVQTTFGDTDKFGFPYIFFTASANGEIISDTHFSIEALLGDLGICFVLSYGVVSILSLLKVNKKKTIIA